MARVLVIEDNRDNLELMRYLLGAFGHEALTAEDGSAGLAVARREHPDLVLCDIHLPGMDGYAVVGELKRDSAFAQTPVVAVTAMAMIGDSERGLRAGFDGYIYKPIDPETFVSQLHAFLRERQRETAPARQPASSTCAPTLALPQSSASILVVDDSSSNRDFIDQTLTPFGFSVQTAANVAQGLHLAGQSTPDLIITDLHMPGSDGLNLIRALSTHAHLAAVPIVVITSSVWGDSQKQAAMQLGAARFLLRPIEPQNLLDEIRACLAATGRAADGDDPRR